MRVANISEPTSDVIHSRSNTTSRIVAVMMLRRNVTIAVIRLRGE
jgi:hypothetical protein